MEIEVKCSECDEFIDADFINIVCESCSEKNEQSRDEELGKTLLEEIFNQWDVDGKFVCGFSTIDEKKEWLKAHNRGIVDAAFQIADFFGIIEKFEELHEINNTKEINPIFPEDL